MRYLALIFWIAFVSYFIYRMFSHGEWWWNSLRLLGVTAAAVAWWLYDTRKGATRRADT